MRLIQVLVIISALLAYHPTHARSLPKQNNIISQDAYVEKVTDGDTIKVRLLPSGEKITVRLLGIDCPESHKNAKCKRDGEQGRKGCAQVLGTMQIVKNFQSPPNTLKY